MKVIPQATLGGRVLRNKAISSLNCSNFFNNSR
jgi:hypothetical protein